MTEDQAIQNQRNAINEGSKTVRNTYLTYLAVTVYIAIAIESITHRQLLIPEDKLQLPFLNIGLPVVDFFFIAPILLLLMHTYFMIHVSQFAKLLDHYRKKNEAFRQTPNETWKLQIDPSIFTGFFLEKDGEGDFAGWIRDVFVLTSFWCLVPVLLCRIQLKFLPYHHQFITPLHQGLVTLAILIAIYFYLRIKPAQKEMNLFFWILDFITIFFKVNWRNFLWIWFKGIRNILFLVFCVSSIFLMQFFSLTVLTIPEDNQSNEAYLVNSKQSIVNFAKDSWKWMVKISNIDLKNKNIKLFKEKIKRSLILLENTTQKTFAWIAIQTNPDLEKEEIKTIQINDIVDRNLILSEKNLAPGPGEILLAKFNDQPRKLLKHTKSLNLKGRDLKFADFSKSDLTKANLKKAKLQGVVFTDTQLQEANLTEANLQGAKLAETKFMGAELVKTELKEAFLAGTQLQGANLRNVKLQGTDTSLFLMLLTGLGTSSPQEMRLFINNFQGTNLTSANFQGTDLRGAQFQGAYLKNAQIQGADLRGAQLQGADLRGAELQGTDLRRAQLQGANLRGAKLQGTDLRGAQLHGVDLFQATIGKVNLSKQYEILEKEIADTSMRENYKKRMKKAKEYSTQFDVLNTNLKINHSCQSNMEECRAFMKVKSLSENEILKLRKKIYANLICKYPVLIDIQLKNQNVMRKFLLSNENIMAAQKACEKKAKKEK